MPIPEEIFDKIKAIQALIDKGATEGEKQAATAALTRLLEHHKITIEEVAAILKPMKKYVFNVTNTFERRLLFQVVRKVTDNVESIDYLRSKNHRRIILELTPDDYEQIKTQFNFYKKQWEEELEIFFTAFLSKHQLFAPSAEAKTDLTDQELMIVIRAQAMQKIMKSLTYTLPPKQLSAKGDH